MLYPTAQIVLGFLILNSYFAILNNQLNPANFHFLKRKNHKYSIKICRHPNPPTKIKHRSHLALQN